MARKHTPRPANEDPEIQASGCWPRRRRPMKQARQAASDASAHAEAASDSAPTTSMPGWPTNQAAGSLSAIPLHMTSPHSDSSRTNSFGTSDPHSSPHHSSSEEESVMEHRSLTRSSPGLSPVRAAQIKAEAEHAAKLTGFVTHYQHIFASEISHLQQVLLGHATHRTRLNQLARSLQGVGDLIPSEVGGIVVSLMAAGLSYQDGKQGKQQVTHLLTRLHSLPAEAIASLGNHAARALAQRYSEQIRHCDEAGLPTLARVALLRGLSYMMDQPALSTEPKAVLETMLCDGALLGRSGRAVTGFTNTALSTTDSKDWTAEGALSRPSVIAEGQYYAPKDRQTDPLKYGVITLPDARLITKSHSARAMPSGVTVPQLPDATSWQLSSPQTQRKQEITAISSAQVAAQIDAMLGDVMPILQRRLDHLEQTVTEVRGDVQQVTERVDGLTLEMAQKVKEEAESREREREQLKQKCWTLLNANQDLKDVTAELRPSEGMLVYAAAGRIDHLNDIITALSVPLDYVSEEGGTILSRLLNPYGVIQVTQSYEQRCEANFKTKLGGREKFIPQAFKDKEDYALALIQKIAPKDEPKKLGYLPRAFLDQLDEDVTPLWLAASWNNPRLVKALLEAGANPYITGKLNRPLKIQHLLPTQTSRDYFAYLENKEWITPLDNAKLGAQFSEWIDDPSVTPKMAKESIHILQDWMEKHPECEYSERSPHSTLERARREIHNGKSLHLL